MPRASRKCCTLAPLPWAAPPRGRSSSITHRQYASYARGGRGGGARGPQARVRLTPTPCTACCKPRIPTSVDTLVSTGVPPSSQLGAGLDYPVTPPAQNNPKSSPQVS